MSNLDVLADLKAKHKQIFDTLAIIVKAINPRPEGNCMCYHETMTEAPELLMKQWNLYYLGKSAQNIFEIGCNAGHSVLFFLLGNPDSKITIFDICYHKYTEPCIEYLMTVFPGRITLIKGNSHETVPKFQVKNPDVKFDLLHVDGYHLYEHVKTDIKNAKNLSAKKNVLLLDDDNLPHLNRLHREFIADGTISLVDDPNLMETKYYIHMVASYNLGTE